MAAKPKALPRLTVEKIREADDLPTEVVNVPEWGGSVVIRGVSKAAFEKFQEMDSPDDVHFLLGLAIVEPEMSVEDIAAMREKSVQANLRIEQAILKASGIDTSAVADAEARFLAE